MPSLIYYVAFAQLQFTVLTYHSKTSPAKVTRLSNIGLLCAMALLVSVVFIGNASFGGLERSWMHKGDLLTALIVVFVLSLRVSRVDAEWAQKHPINEGMGINCKTLLVIFLALTLIKFIAMTDFIGPTKMLADGSDMTAFAMWMWSFMDVMILEILLAILDSELFSSTPDFVVISSSQVKHVNEVLLLPPLCSFFGAIASPPPFISTKRVFSVSKSKI